jgi:putative SOS response-associated peptidase YedK
VRSKSLRIVEARPGSAWSDGREGGAADELNHAAQCKPYQTSPGHGKSLAASSSSPHNPWVCIRYDKDLHRIVRWSKAIRAWIPIEDWTEGLDTFPGYVAPILIQDAEHGKKLVAASWGMVPWWAKELSFGRKNAFNARSESLTEKPTFKDAFRRRRCIVPATAYYERDLAAKTWLRFVADDVLAIAGLWEPENKLSSAPTFAMVTTEPSKAIAEVHDRMPVILSPADMERWMDPEAEVAELLAMLEPAPEGLLRMEDGGPILPPTRKARAGETLF